MKNRTRLVAVVAIVAVIAVLTVVVVWTTTGLLSLIGPSEGSADVCDCPGLVAAGTANIWLSPSGDDQGVNCRRSAAPVPAPLPSSVCSSFGKADQIASRGDTIRVLPGVYPASSTESFGSATFLDRSTPVRFVCAEDSRPDSVTFADPVFAFNPGAANIVVSGSCFHFHIVQVGLGGSCYCGGEGSRANIVSGVTLDGVHMDSFDITGAQGLTIKNSQIGPLDACFGIGKAAAFGAPASAECDPNNPIEAYWATIPTGTLGLQDEPYIHSNGDLSGVTLTDNHFTGMQTKWSTVFHQGGLLIWDAPGLVMSGNVFDHNAIYDIEFNATTVVNGMTFQNNVLGAAYDGLEQSDPPVPLPATQCQEGMNDNSGTSTFTNVLWRYNTFANCFNMGSTSTYNNVRFVGNLIGNGANCAAQTGISYAYNAAGNRNSCQDGLSISGSPFTNSSTGDLTIPPTHQPTTTSPAAAATPPSQPTSVTRPGPSPATPAAAPAHTNKRRVTHLHDGQVWARACTKARDH